MGVTKIVSVSTVASSAVQKELVPSREDSEYIAVAALQYRNAIDDGYRYAVGERSESGRLYS